MSHALRKEKNINNNSPLSETIRWKTRLIYVQQQDNL